MTKQGSATQKSGAKAKSATTRPTPRRGGQDNATELVRVALDEFNLATFPISVLDKKAQSSREPLVFHDTITWNGEMVERHWKVFPHPEKGFPGPIDDDVLMALLELTREQGGAKKVFFSRYDLLKRLGWSINATYYTRLETSFKKLAAVRVEAINAFGDRARKRFVNMGLTFIQEWKLNAETRGGDKTSYVLWSDRIADSIHQELTRYLDASFYFEELSSAIERRLFRYLDNYFDGKQPSLAVNVRDLAHEHLGISRHYKYVSQIMQRLEPALTTLLDKGYLESWLLAGESLYLNKRPDFGNRVQMALPYLGPFEPIGDTAGNSMAQLERLLVERGVVPAVAARLCATDTDEQRDRLDRAIRYLDAEVAAGKRFSNPGGFLVSLVGKNLGTDAAARRTPSTRTSSSNPARQDVPQAPSAGARAAAVNYDNEYAYMTYLSEVGVQRYNELTSDDVLELANAKRRELLASEYEKTFRNMPGDAFEEHIRYMIRKDLATRHAKPFDAWVAERLP